MTAIPLENDTDDASDAPYRRSLYVREQGAVVARVGRRLVISKDDVELENLPVHRVEHLILFGNCALTTPASRLCLAEGVPVTFLTFHGRYCGRLGRGETTHLDIVLAQTKRFADEAYHRDAARWFVNAKLLNQRATLRRFRENAPEDKRDLIGTVETDMQKTLDAVHDTESLDAIRGHEGDGSRSYFRAFAALLPSAFPFASRQQRPATDPSNSLLNHGYTLLTNAVEAFLRIEGIDPRFGHLHTPDDSRPALAFDLTEEFRAPIVDRVVLSVLNAGTLTPDDFETTDELGCRLTKEGMRRFLTEYERKMNAPVRHSISGIEHTWRGCIHAQARHYRSWLRGEVPHYRPVRIR
jgi:CRISPR-associated protein Cas1